MYHKLCKRIGLVFLSVFLVLSLPVLSFADTRGKMDPDDYLFLTVFRACGVSPGVDVGKWAGLYKGYLRKTGNKALLSQVEGYASLGWGDTVQGVDTLLESVKAWLSLSDSYGTDAVGYRLPSSPAPQVKTASYDRETSVLVTPFSDLPFNKAGYRYSFSVLQGNYISSENAVMSYRHNFYFPDTAEIFGIVEPFSYYNYNDFVRVEFYRVSDSGYIAQQYYSSYKGYYPDGSLFVDGGSNYSGMYYSLPACSVMNLPFPVFTTLSDASEYCKSKSVNNSFNATSGFLTSLGQDSGLDSELQKREFISVSSTLILPKSLDEASAKVNAFQKPLGRKELTSVLSSSGINVSYNAGYKVEHLRESIPSGSDGEPGWESYSEEVFYGVPGAIASFTPLKLEGYTYVPELTEPERKEILADESLVIRLYYTLNRAPYVVEHYKQDIVPGEEGTKWKLTDTETFTGISGVQATYQEKDYPNYLFDQNLTEPSDRQILPDGSLVIRLYYIQDPEAIYPYTVEYYKDGECFETVSKTVPMFGDRMVQDYEDFCPKYYLLDEEASTSLPFSVTEENDVIRVYYIPDTSNPYTPILAGTEDLASSSSGFFGKVFLGLFVLLLLGLFINRILAFVKRTASQTESENFNKKKKTSYPRRRHSGRRGGNYAYRKKGKKSRY